MKLSGELDYRIRYDVEHDLFHAQNVFTGKQVYKQRKKFEKLLQKMLDKKIIKSWFYNGEYHVAFNEVH